ncbi:RraA family protein [Halomonas binhaiensis]|uniref:Putative 4-hydroxy-4-methyl-2-oxoglutarate aldolase n=1 Tax=Halomonas binhaiensis TaxID=2562282 RepID=A0A5C1NHE8_9GAMM|nr:RraA family protein [Halomonas binhaiensis]QEM82716.1 RraA family protein [Halomonas binhaiensis]
MSHEPSFHVQSFHIRPREERIPAELVQRFQDIATSTLGHFTDFGAITSLQPIRRPIRMLGTALTVRIPHIDGSIIRQALLMACPGDVLVIDMSGDDRRACWGELRAYAALRKGLAGVVTSGAITDWHHLSRLALPVYSRGTSPLTTRALELEGEINVPVAIDGVSINPGDLVLGDDDGIFVVPPHRAASLLEQAIDKQAQEDRRRQELAEAYPHWFATHAK